MQKRQARIVVAMGVSGSGKSTLGEALRDGYGFRFIDGDDTHPAANVEKMRAGIPLTDADRAPWLTGLAALLADAAARGEDTVLACSALKACYRDCLLESGAAILFAYLAIERETVMVRVDARPGHYMPALLVESQFAALEEPEPGTNVLRLAASGSVEAHCQEVVKRLSRGTPRQAPLQTADQGASSGLWRG
ncbi:MULTISPECIES: gluconokinase [unclassified Aureimonas]|uniref:gluconokinase n=1 Tax=unclassified Aureimonas TaxID=2615206 RepID=UPI001FCD89FB|nr:MULTISPECIES: gluconokinase [unclassified Aureimonas]